MTRCLRLRWRWLALLLAFWLPLQGVALAAVSLPAGAVPLPNGLAEHHGDCCDHGQACPEAAEAAADCGQTPPCEHCNQCLQFFAGYLPASPNRGQVPGAAPRHGSAGAAYPSPDLPPEERPPAIS